MWSPERMAPQWKLVAHRPWRPDRDLGVYTTFDEAKTKGDSIGCKFNAK